MAVEVTDERIAAAAARLHEGGWSFTPRQLYYAVCADVETAPVRMASGEVGLGLVLILVGVITANRTVLLVLGSIGAALVVLGGYTHLQERRPLPLSRPLALSFADFEGLLRAQGDAYPGLITGAPAPEGATGMSPPYTVVCDRAETAEVLRANRARLGDVPVLLRADDARDIGQVVTVHDCDPAGCALVADLRDRGLEVTDAGINPGELLGRRLQLIEGAPARLPRDLSLHLQTAEIDWLRGGRRLELATLTPEELVMRVRGAVAG
jgi:hypothetical protein